MSVGTVIASNGRLLTSGLEMNASNVAPWALGPIGNMLSAIASRNFAASTVNGNPVGTPINWCNTGRANTLTAQIGKSATKTRVQRGGATAVGLPGQLPEITASRLIRSG